MRDLLLAHPQRSAGAILLLFGLLSTFYNAYLPLHGDEAYYWVWSHRLQSGYFDHAPLLAWLIALSNLISESTWGVRLWAVLGMSGAGWYLYALTCKLSNPATALTALFIYLSVAMVHVGFTIITPDAALVLFWSMALFYGYRALFENHTPSFWLLGVALGLMMLGKYSAILFVFFLLLFALLKRRDLLADRRVYGVALIALLIVSPMLWWNYRHEWISFLFQLQHGSAKATGVDFGRFLEYFGGQFGLFSPLFGLWLFYLLAKQRAYFSDERRFYLALSALTPLLFFGYKSLFSVLELNYTAPAYLGATVLLALHVKGHERLFKIALGIALAMSLTLRVLLLSHLEVVQERMYGYEAAIELLHSHAEADDAYYGDHLTTAALLSYYLPNHPSARVGISSRMSQYDLWYPNPPQQKGLFLGKKPLEKALLEHFTSVALIDTLSVKKGLDGHKTFYIYRVAP
ncbi:MAG: glycosyltransferase family 39 protein [Campylobacterales bacterium]|nr:glycosyltransferase family 39 protein [Campylobacterales bacterium]